MDLKEIATLSGKGGLFKVVKPTRNGVILETLDNQKQRLTATAQHRISILDEISIYTKAKEGSTPLATVFSKIHKEFETDIGVDKNDDGEELKAFLKHVVPDYDEERVYVSDIKKLVNWYSILANNFPEIFKEKKKEKPDSPADSEKS